MTLIIRDSHDADLPAITDIYRQAVQTDTASFEYDPPDLAEMAKRRADVLSKTFPHLVAERDGTVVGYAYVNTYRIRPACRFAVENSIYIASNQQGTGIGRQLLTTLLQRCETIGLRLVIAVIGDSATLPSIRPHTNRGFAHAGTLPNVGCKHGRWLDSIFMVRPLGPGATTPPPAGA